MDGFKRQQKQKRPAPVRVALPEQATELPPASAPAVQTSPQDNPGLLAVSPTRNRRWYAKKRFYIPLILLGLVMAGGMAAIAWYQSQLRPVGESVTPQKIVITKDTSYSFVVKRLEERGVIRSGLAATIYGYLSGKNAQLKEGTCMIVGTSSTEEIIDKLTKGCHDFKSITFFPGATIEKPLYKPVHAELSDTMHIKHVLSASGYSDTAIQSALTKQYASPLFADKPAGMSLEGYIYGQTYYVDSGASAETVLETTFAQMYSDITKNDLIKKFKAQGLTLYQGITLASIVQRELNCEGKPTKERIDRCYGYQQTIAQIFLKRLKEGTSLGSDVTFIYAADQKGVTPTVNIDSPYNTRVHTGLPPGPIASPGLHALLAVGNPSDTDYLFFIAGDDGLIYFAKDGAGHEINIKNHCQQLCSEL